MKEKESMKILGEEEKRESNELKTESIRTVWKKSSFDRVCYLLIRVNNFFHKYFIYSQSLPCDRENKHPISSTNNSRAIFSQTIITQRIANEKSNLQSPPTLGNLNRVALNVESITGPKRNNGGRRLTWNGLLQEEARLLANFPRFSSVVWIVHRLARWWSMHSLPRCSVIIRRWNLL